MEPKMELEKLREVLKEYLNRIEFEIIEASDNIDALECKWIKVCERLERVGVPVDHTFESLR